MKTYYEDLDCDQAADEINKLYQQTGLTHKVYGPVPGIENKWMFLEFKVQFADKTGLMEIFNYRMGIGLFNLKKIKNLRSRIPIVLSGDEQSMLYALLSRPHANYKNKRLQVETVAAVAKATKQGPDPAQVLATCCSDGIDAIEERFEDWAVSYGYDVDSRSAERIYRTCQEQYHKVRNLLNREKIDRFAELSRML